MSVISTPTYAVVRRAARPTVTVARTVTMTTISQVADEIAVLIGWLAAHGLPAAGPPFLRYLVIDMAGDLLIQAGVPVSGPVQGDADVELDELPEGDYLTTMHVGAYEGLYGATGALLAHAGRHGLRFDKHPSDAGEVWTSRLEWFETAPLEGRDPARWTTRLEFKLADG